MTIRLFILLLIIITSQQSIFALAEPPNNNSENDLYYDEQYEDQPSSILNTNTNQDNEEPIYEDVNPEEVEEPEFDISEEQRYEINKNFDKALKKEQLNTAYGLLKELPSVYHTDEQKEVLTKLEMFNTIENEMENESGEFFKIDELDQEKQKTIKRLYKQAQVSLINKDDKVAKDLLIQILNTHRRNLKAKKLLNYGLGLKTGSYKIEDVNKKYWKKSEVSFYGGNYERALEYLQLLAKIDNTNPEVFDRIGSNYYMMGEKRKAIDAWNTAVFLKPDNEELKVIIKKTEDMIEKEFQEEKAREKARKATAKKVEKVENKQLMGVFSDQTKAYNFARQYQKRGLAPIVEEDEDGRWSVSLPK